MKAIERTTKLSQTPVLSECLIAGFALVALLTAQWMLSSAIHGTNYTGGDGKMAQATILIALKFAKFFNVTNINPIEGIGSQLLPMNVWANPAYWPFAVLDKRQATDISALIALGIFASACYIMARCFDVPILPSAIAAQLCIVLFAPVVLVLELPTVFCLNPGNAVVYAPYMIALGLLSRLDVGPPRVLVVTTAAIFALLLYSIYCDPLWTMIAAISWSIPFAVVTFTPLHLKTILVRAAALGCSFALLLLTGAAEYLYTLSQYTARVQFSQALDRTRVPELVSALFTSPIMKYFYLVWLIGWVLGLLTLHGRSRVLIGVALAAWIAYSGYSVVYLLLANATWIPPIPIYVEQCLFVLFSTAGFAGYWGAAMSVPVVTLALVQRAYIAAMHEGNFTATLYWSRLLQYLNAGAKGMIFTKFLQFRFKPIAAAFVVVGIFPAMLADFAVNRSQRYAEQWDEQWADAPELERFLLNKIGLTVGQPFRGSLHFWNDPDNAIANVWSRGIPTIEEYSQLVTPQVIYFVHALLRKEVGRGLNWFSPDPGCCWPTFGKAAQMFGVRYLVGDRISPAAGHMGITLPRHATTYGPAI